MKKYLLLLVSCLAFFLNVRAQDLKEDLNLYFKKAPKINEQTVTTTNVNYNKERYESISQVVVAGEDFYFLRSNGIDYLMTFKHYVMVHKERKICLYRKHELEEFDPSDLTEQHVDSMLAKVSDVSYLGIKKGQKCYKANSLINRYGEIEIFLNANTNALEKVTYWFKDPQEGDDAAMEMTFDQSKTVPSHLYDVNNYLSFKEGTPVLKQSFKNYKFIQLD